MLSQRPSNGIIKSKVMFSFKIWLGNDKIVICKKSDLKKEKEIYLPEQMKPSVTQSE